MKLAFFICLFMGILWRMDDYTEAKKLFDNKQYKASIDICTKELEKLQPKDSLFEKFLFLRASSYTELQDFQSGIKDYLVLVQVYPRQISYYVGLSYMYGQIGNYKDCISILEKTLTLEPENIYTFNNLSYYSSRDGNYNEALKYADDGLKFVTDSTWKGALLSNKGYGLIGLKKYKDALANINESINLNQDNSFAYYFRAIANINLKSFETVCGDLNKAKSLGAETMTKELIQQYCH
ncbi:MAG: repeat protein [Mucilaginibacter sp.]|nr:repeat protein [Mucilaginibacter sp.]